MVDLTDAVTDSPSPFVIADFVDLADFTEASDTETSSSTADLAAV